MGSLSSRSSVGTLVKSCFGGEIAVGSSFAIFICRSISFDCKGVGSIFLGGPGWNTGSSDVLVTGVTGAFELVVKSTSSLGGSLLLNPSCIDCI